jgi:hypothetical protein
MPSVRTKVTWLVMLIVMMWLTGPDKNEKAAIKCLKILLIFFIHEWGHSTNKYFKPNKKIPVLHTFGYMQLFRGD